MRTTVFLTLAAIAAAPLTGQARVRAGTPVPRGAQQAPRAAQQAPRAAQQAPRAAQQAPVDRDHDHDQLLRELRRIIRQEVRAAVRDEVREALDDMGMGARRRSGPWMRGRRPGPGRSFGPGMGIGMRGFAFEHAPEAIELDVEVEEGEHEGQIFRALRLHGGDEGAGASRALFRTLLREHDDHGDHEGHSEAEEGDGHESEGEPRPRVLRWVQSAPKNGRAVVIDVPGEEEEVFVEVVETKEAPKADAADPRRVILRMPHDHDAPKPEPREVRDTRIKVRSVQPGTQDHGDAVDQLRKLEARKKLEEIRTELQGIELDRAGGKASVESKARQLEELRRSLESMRKSLEAMRERVEQQRGADRGNDATPAATRSL